MALKAKKSVKLTGTSVIDEQQVVYFSADITTETAGNTSISQNIQNQALYRERLAECRKDMNEFQEIVWQTEDMLFEKTTE